GLLTAAVEHFRRNALDEQQLLDVIYWRVFGVIWWVQSLVIIALRAGWPGVVIGVNPVKNGIGNNGNVAGIHAHRVEHLLDERRIGRVDVDLAFQLGKGQRNGAGANREIGQRFKRKRAVGFQTVAGATGPILLQRGVGLI